MVAQTFSLLFHDCVNIHESRAQMKQCRYLNVLHAFIPPCLLPPQEQKASVLQLFTSSVHQVPGVKRCRHREWCEPRATHTAARVRLCRRSPNGHVSLQISCQCRACAHLRDSTVPPFRSGLQQSLAFAFKGKPVFTSPLWCT